MGDRLGIRDVVDILLNRWESRLLGRAKKILSEVGFEPTPSYEDQNSLQHSLSREQGLALSLAP